MPETWVQSLGREGPLEEGMSTHSSILLWRIHGQRRLAAIVHGVTESDVTEHNTIGQPFPGLTLKKKKKKPDSI